MTIGSFEIAHVTAHRWEVQREAMNSIRIGKHVIGPGEPTYVIAEAGPNHEGVLATAERMVVEAARAGAHAIKFQTYEAGKLATQTAPKYWSDPDGPHSTQYDAFKQTDLFRAKDWRQLKHVADREGITFLSSAWDEESIDMVDDLGVLAFKIGSADITTPQLLRHCAKKSKPIILSTGASTLGEIKAAVDATREAGCDQIILLHCILSYPTQYRDANLLMLRGLQEAFTDIPVGYSDHTFADATMTVPLVAAALGARVIEKHFTLDKSRPGYDHYHSMDAADLAKLMSALTVMHHAIGTEKHRKPIPAEEAARRLARRSVVAKVDIPRGRVIAREMLTYKRPGTGISPADFERVVGRRARVDISADSVITWEHV